MHSMQQRLEVSVPTHVGNVVSPVEQCVGRITT